MKITNEGWAIIERDTHMGKWVEEHKRLDFDQNALPQMLRYINSDSIVLDIGANIGCYAYGFAQKAKQVICFEPNPEARECLNYNMQKCGSDHSILPYPVSDDLFCYDVICENDNIGMAYLIPNEESKICAIRIDDCDYIERVDFIKIDVEGFELSVLKSAKKTIEKYSPVLVIEINDHTLNRIGETRDQIFEWLTDNGYSYRNIYEGQTLTDSQLDIICFKIK